MTNSPSERQRTAVMLRPLQEEDAQTSYGWRNDARIWQYTGNRPDKVVTEAMERDWLRQVLARPNEARFAICVGAQHTYVGNVQLTHITAGDAEFHIFIGDTRVHGQGVGTQATQLILDYARETLGLHEVYLSVHQDNLAAIRTYEKCGFICRASDGDRLTFFRKL